MRAIVAFKTIIRKYPHIVLVDKECFRIIYVQYLPGVIKIILAEHKFIAHLNGSLNKFVIGTNSLKCRNKTRSDEVGENCNRDYYQERYHHLHFLFFI